MDKDPIQTQEWLDALASVIQYEGIDRARDILNAVLARAEQSGVPITSALITPYRNSIPVSKQPPYPGDLILEKKITAIHRWNALAMVRRAKRDKSGLGGHLSSYASIADLYEVGFNHFFRAPHGDFLGDLIFFQGHSAEGNYARAFLEGRLSETHLVNFRQEVGGMGLSSYPHPWLMKDFWQFASVSLGLGPMQAIYQARFIKYLENRKLVKPSDRRVWIFAGDGEMDEPDSIAGLTLAAREKLDNLIYVVNCNLQRLDGLVRSNDKIIQELESLFKGAGWHVIKVVWDGQWDALFEKDNGDLQQYLNTHVDGELQHLTVQDGAFRREHLFGKTPAMMALVAHLSDQEIEKLGRGGHDPLKIYAAYAQAVAHTGQPVAILAHTVKGYGIGGAAESRNVAHNQLDMTEEDTILFRERFELPLTDDQLKNLSFYKPDENSAEMVYLKKRRAALGGALPARQVTSDALPVPDLDAFSSVLKGSGDRVLSSTMAFARILNIILKDKTLGPRVVPIFSDEVRTFGMEALFRQIGIYSPKDQLYTPEDKSQLMYYREAKDGQILEEGITEAGSIASWIAAATAYSVHQFPMIPFFTYYSMFGFQRVGDYIWAANDMRARGFLIGATAGRTTLEGEGLQHQDGSSLLAASSVPNCIAYDPTFSYEMAVIIQDGLRRMMQEKEDVFYYITAMNEKYEHPDMPEGVASGIIRGLYLFKENKEATVQLFGSGAILREVIFASELLEKEFNISANVWSATSFNELQRDGVRVARQQLLSAAEKTEKNYVEHCLENHVGPVIAATDYVRNYAEQIRPFVKNRYITLGTDGFGRSDTREKLREFFEVNRYYIVVAALYALAQDKKISMTIVKKAMTRYHIDPSKPNPVTV